MSVPKVWSHFSAKSSDGTVLKFRIEDMPEDRMEDALKLLMAYFAPEESLHRGSGVPKNPEAMAELLEIYKEYWHKKPHIVTICVHDDETENKSELLGASVMVLETKEESEEIDDEEAKTTEVKKLFDIATILFAKYSVFKNYDVDKFYDDRGVVVLPKYRGLGIAQEFFRVRRLMCKEHNIPITGGWMTSFGSQKAAIRDGWETVMEVNYEEFGREMEVKFENVPESCIFMIARGE